MIKTPCTLLAGTFALVAVTSCSLPQREAWRQIQRDGLIPFVATQWSSDSTPSMQTTRQMMAQAPKKETSAPLVAATTGTSDKLIGPPVVANTTPSPAMIDAKSIPQAQTVPGLVGYVRTPYTNPPRLVDVRGMNAGSKVVCPFTNKPFLVPASTALEPAKVAAAPVPTYSPVAQTPKTLSPAPVQKAPTTPTTVAAMNKPQPSAPPAPAPTSSISPKPQVAATPAPAPSASPPPAKVETQEIPFGNAISGRPGFVNSPYAAKHQLVDVTGLPVGMEVKCPYTGKLFRVPPQEQVQGKLPAQNTASPEKK